MLATGLLLTTREEEHQEALFSFRSDAFLLLHIEAGGEQHGDARALSTSLPATFTVKRNRVLNGATRRRACNSVTLQHSSEYVFMEKCCNARSVPLLIGKENTVSTTERPKDARPGRQCLVLRASPAPHSSFVINL
ncbi:hypothetical protein EYF80_014324 [Liparis tanakae]|uniref:Uncharacterized protein n=1 Tax=Liparis tanakae TaxID=230148 RepID=A0A4Z2IDW4_9TELE|nr:hypothetical protein EYF80_014324 [Liparis tanakae]